jgi:hypothetical protein
LTRKSAEAAVMGLSLQSLSQKRLRTFIGSSKAGFAQGVNWQQLVYFFGDFVYTRIILQCVLF